MDTTQIRPAVDALNGEIARLVQARDTLLNVLNGSGPTPAPAQKKKPTAANARSEGQRKRWAEQKRKQREAAKAAKVSKKAVSK